MKSLVMIGSMPKPRTNKRISALQQISKVSLLCWDRMNESQLNLQEGIDYPVYIEHIKAANDPVKRAVPYYLFSHKALAIIEKADPDIIHVEGLDMLKIAEKYKKSSKKKVIIIYEVPDLRRLITEPQKGIIKNILKRYVCNQEVKLCNETDLIIITSQMFYEKHYKSFMDYDKFVYMPNVPEFKAFKGFNKHQKGDKIVVGWIGSIRYKKQMRNLIETAKKKDFKLLVAGYEDEPKEIEPLCINNPNVEWFGMYNYDQDVADLYSKCDIIYAVYDATKINEQIALPNKLYESVYCELPIIVSKGTHLAEIVEEWGVGRSVMCDSVTELENTIEELEESSQYEKYVANCKKHKREINIEYYNEKLLSRINLIRGCQ